MAIRACKTSINIYIFVFLSLLSYSTCSSKRCTELLVKFHVKYLALLCTVAGLDLEADETKYMVIPRDKNAERYHSIKD